MSADLLHESARAHVTGEARYVDDLPVPEQLLAGSVVTSPHARARIVSCDLNAARAVPGVHAVLAAADIPGENQVGPVVPDEPLLASGEVTFAGQAVVIIAAETDVQCRAAARLVRIEYEPLDAIVDLPAAMAAGMLLGPPRRIERGDAAAAVRTAPHRIDGELLTGAQEHWYLETQVALCVPFEGGRMKVFSSTQHPSEVQALVAGVLGWQRNAVEVEVRRIGGGFGGKETQANPCACWAALLAHATGRPVKLRLFRDDDMIMTGKRHRFVSRYEAGFDDQGLLLGATVDLNSDGGASTDLSFAILERAMLHADNAYYVPALRVTGSVWKTNLPSNTAFRGFGGPQGMAVMETIMDRIARTLGLDPAEVRRRNYYRAAPADTTHYGQPVAENRLPVMHERLVASSDYSARRAETVRFNAVHEFEKRGIAMTPVKFGVSFTTTFLNQAAALVHLYTDGSVLVSHGGVEMGQGLHTKILGIAAAELGVDPSRVRVGPTQTAVVPNTSATAASSGADMNGMAVKDAIDTLKRRMAAALAPALSRPGEEPTRPEDIVFAESAVSDVRHPGRRMGLTAAVNQLYHDRVSLSASGFFRTPEIGWDREAGRGTPFRYYAYGMAVSEVEVDLLTGGHRLLRVDILHDAGDPLNPTLDRGQVEGGFVQGMGWCTMEEVVWDGQGHLLTHSPDTYKIPAAGDVPEDLRVELLQDAPNSGTIRNSKAVGEPPFMLALSAWLAIKDALSAVRDHRVEPVFALPATRERIVMEAQRLRCLQ